jgi:hypothetical protein
VRTFIDHLVEHFSQTPNSQLGEQWVKDGMTRPAPATVSHANGTHAEPEAFDGVEPLTDTVESERTPKSARASAPRTRTSAISPL